MKHSIRLYSIIAAALLIAASFVCVVGYPAAQADEKAGASPLFTIRTQQATLQPSQVVLSTFLGKGQSLRIFPSASSSYEDLIQRALRIFGSNPALVQKLLENLNAYPEVAGLLANQGVTPADIHRYMALLQHDPSVVTQAIAEMQQELSQNDPQKPLGLSTSSSLGCFIVALVALLPITLTLTLLVLFFTLRILTCMNVNDCANIIAKGIWDQLIQGLTQE